MSRSTVILAAVLGCVVLFAVWIGTGDEKPATPASDEQIARPQVAAKPAFPHSQQAPRVFDRPNSRRDDADAPGDEPRPETKDGGVVVKDGLRPQVGGNAEARRLKREERRERREQRQGRMGEQGVQAGEQGNMAGVARRGALSRKGAAEPEPPGSQPESEGMGKTEQPPLRQAEPEIDEDSLEHLRDVALSDPDPDERADAISQLDLDDPAAMEVLVKALDDSDSDVRLAALDELWTNSDEPPLDILARVVNDPDPEVRVEAVRILSESEDPYAQTLLRGALTDRNEEVRSEAAEALEVD